MAGSVWRILFVDDDKDICRQAQEHFEEWRYGENQVEVDIENDFANAMYLLERQRYELVILDVFHGEVKVSGGGDQRGKSILEEIKKRRFIPIIFYTALPLAVKELESALIKVASKDGKGFANLDAGLRAYLDLPLMRINRELSRHFDETLRDYLWSYISAHWNEISASGEDDATLAYLLCRRIAASLDIEGAEKLALRLTATPENTSIVKGKAHPLRYYIMPPETTGYLTGDVLKDTEDSYCIILTPWCDLTTHGEKPPKAEHVIVAFAEPLDSFSQYQDWIAEEDPSNTKRKALISILRAPDSTLPGKQAGRHYFLPGALDLPNLVLDFQQTYSRPIDTLTDLAKIATLDSPFAEAVVSSYTRFLGRVGAPDLDVDKVLDGLKSKT